MTFSKYTLPALLDYSCAKFEQHQSLNFVQTGNRTYGDLLNDVTSIANMLLNLDIHQGDKVAILSANMPNWGITQFAIAKIGAVSVPILPGFSTSDITNILTHAEVKVLFVSKLLYDLVANIHTDFLTTKILSNSFRIIEDGYPAKEIEKLDVPYDYQNLSPLPKIKIDEEDTASIIYTSGTTGFSKGVVLTHKNIVWNAEKCATIQPINGEDRFMSILPMAHTYENTLGLILPVMFGAAVYYLDRPPTPSLLVPALQKIKPTVMLSVPLVIEKIYKAQIMPKFNKTKFTKIMYAFPPFRKLLNRIAGKVLYKTFGGHIKFFGIGGAKLDPVVERFLHEGKFPYAIGYGLTETSPMSAGSSPATTHLGTIGPAMEGVELKINEPDEKGQGEIWIRGPHVMKGYYQKPELTAESVTPDGWFKSGDLGYIDKKGRLSIRGRLKTMLLGASGENIYPEEIESILNNFHLVEEALVVKNKGKLIAIVKLKKEELEKMLLQQKAKYKLKQTEKTTDHEEEKKEILTYINARVNNFSKLTKIEISEEPFEKTPTQKIKRYKYQDPQEK